MEKLKTVRIEKGECFNCSQRFETEASAKIHSSRYGHKVTFTEAAFFTPMEE